MKQYVQICWKLFDYDMYDMYISDQYKISDAKLSIP